MNQPDLANLSVANLVKRYAEFGVEEDKAWIKDDAVKRITLIRQQMWAIQDELKSRHGDHVEYF